MRVCWNRQTGTFEGRVSLAYGFKSRHSHQKIDLAIAKSIFLSKPTGLVYHQIALRFVYHHCVSSAYHHTVGVYKNTVGLMIYKDCVFDDMQFLTELMIYKAPP